MHINIQPVEKQDLRDDGRLLVNSIFYTIQGEGPFVGRPAIFMRLAGCNLQCPHCDTEYTNRVLMSPSQILDCIANKIHWECAELNGNKMLVVITGGEPFRQNLKDVTDLLIYEGFTVQIETNGTLFQELHESVWIVCSPKTGSINKQLIPRINAFKYVVDAGNVDEDGLPLSTLGHPVGGFVYKANKANGVKYADIYIQPADHQDPVINEANLEAAKKSVMKFNRTLCIQTHKIVGVA